MRSPPLLRHPAVAGGSICKRPCIRRSSPGDLFGGPGAEVEVSEGRFGLFDTPDFRDSPVVHVIATGETLRRRLADPASADFPILL